jgi:hypothetical protein
MRLAALLASPIIKFALLGSVLGALGGMMVGPAAAQERILISSEWGNVTAELNESDASRALARMLPLTLDMHDHLRQEKTVTLPSPLPAGQRQLDFAVGTLGLWSAGNFVIYYRAGQVPQPGIIILGRVTGDVSFLDRPGSVTVRVQRAIATQVD